MQNRMQLSVDCFTVVVCDATPEAAQARFEAWAQSQPDDAPPTKIEIKRMVMAQFHGELLAESGAIPVEWTQIEAEVLASLPATEGAALEPGYWADVNQLVPRRNVPPGLEAMRQALAEDDQAALNWAAERQFFFVVSVLSPKLPEVYQEPDAGLEEGPTETESDLEASSLHYAEAAIPELVEREYAVLVRARNAVVAAWLWRRFAAELPSGAYDLALESWPGIIGLELGTDASDHA